jgi:hypothetical protein
MRIYKLSHLAQALNSALGSGRYHDITYKDVRERIDDGTIFEFLEERLGLRVVLSTLRPVDRLELLLEWDDFRLETPLFDCHRSGLCLLVSYLLEGIIRRAQNRDYRLTLETCGAAVPGGELNSKRDD